MPIRSREINDQISESRIRQIIQAQLSRRLRRVEADSVSASVTSFTNTQTWTVTVPKEPIAAFWQTTSTAPSATFDTFQFNTSVFDQVSPIKTLYSSFITYNPVTQLLSIQWGSPKTGTLTVYNYGNGVTYSAIGVAD